MERDLSCIVDLIHEAYPTLDILLDLEEWLAGSFQPPIAFVQTKAISEQGNTLTSYKVNAEAGIVLYYKKEQGIFQPIATEPLRAILRRERYSYKGKTDGLYIDIDPGTLDIRTEKKDRAEITFRFAYTLAVPKQPLEKIHHFDLEEV